MIIDLSQFDGFHMLYITLYCRKETSLVSLYCVGSVGNNNFEILGLASLLSCVFITSITVISLGFDEALVKSVSR